MFGVHARISSIRQRARHDINGRVIRHDHPKHDVQFLVKAFEII